MKSKSISIARTTAVIQTLAALDMKIITLSLVKYNLIAIDWITKAIATVLQHWIICD